MAHERRAHRIYDKILEIVKKSTKGKTVYSDNLLKYGNVFLPHEFKGVFASDNLPKLNAQKPYAIVNVDSQHQNGSHWLAVIHTKKGKMLVYDSFGRKSKELVPALFKGEGTEIIDSDYDPEQLPSQVDCGARCLAYLVLCKYWNEDMAKLI